MSKKDEKNNPSKEEAEENRQQELTEESEAIVIETDEESEAQKKIDEYKDIAQRLQAEFDNYRKRNNESVRVARNEGIDDVICSMLEILDNFERGIAAVEDERAKSGMELIYKQMLALLSKFDVVEIEALGKEFDPKFHHAIAQCEDKEKSNIIVEVYQKGYKRKDKVLRASMVKVAQ